MPKGSLSWLMNKRMLCTLQFAALLQLIVSARGQSSGGSVGMCDDGGPGAQSASCTLGSDCACLQRRVVSGIKFGDEAWLMGRAGT